MLHVRATVVNRIEYVGPGTVFFNWDIDVTQKMRKCVHKSFLSAFYSKIRFYHQIFQLTLKKPHKKQRITDLQTYIAYRCSVPL